MEQWQKLVLIALASAAGTSARYGLGGWVQEHSGKLFPWGAVTVNLLGCLAFGVIWSSLEERRPTSGETRAIIVEIVDTPERVAAFLPELDRMIDEGLITLERARVIAYRHSK
jgi:hypothetical protein